MEECLRLKESPGIIWVNVTGVHDSELLGDLGELFGLHSLTLEDIANTTQRPKTEEFDAYLFVVLKMISYEAEEDGIHTGHISLILGEGYVLSFLEDEEERFQGVRQRIRSGKGRIRRMKAGYLAYSLMDTVVDRYFLVLERIGERIEDIDEQIVDHPQTEHMEQIHALKRSMATMRRSVWPLREEIALVEKSESELFESGTKPFLRDLYDHTIQVIEVVDSYRDILTSLHDTYLSSLSNRMNEVMKVLTMIATIFIPLTFVAGIYGMNFAHMPELGWTWGYFAVWGVMITITVFMIAFFKRRDWL